MSYRGWQSWARRFRQEWSTAEDGGSDAVAERAGRVSGRLFWMALFMGLVLATRHGGSMLDVLFSIFRAAWRAGVLLALGVLYFRGDTL